MDWTRWRAFLDRLSLHPELIPEAIYSSPRPSGHQVIDDLVAEGEGRALGEVHAR